MKRARTKTPSAPTPSRPPRDREAWRKEIRQIVREHTAGMSRMQLRHTQEMLKFLGDQIRRPDDEPIETNPKLL